MSMNFAGKNFEAKNFQAGNFPGGGVQSASVGCDGVYYANRSDIELLYGTSNVTKWADVDNNGVLDDITNRICWALQNATADIDSRLLGGPYKIKFATPYPIIIITLCARLAGIMLYDSRGITDFSEEGLPKHQLFYHKEMVNTTMNGILSRKIRIPLLIDEVLTHPAIVVE